FYVNGEEIYARLLGGYGPGDSTSYIGSDANKTVHWQGGMADLRIWHVTRTRQEIRDGMYGGITGDEPDLRAYWPLDEGTGTTGDDLSPNGYDLTLNPEALTPTWRHGVGWPLDLPEGDHTLCVQERDDAGNWSIAGCATVTADRTPPALPAVTCTEFDTTTATWDWISGGGDGSGSFRYKLDDADLSLGATGTTDGSLSFTAPAYAQFNGSTAFWEYGSIYLEDGHTVEAWVLPDSVVGAHTIIESWNFIWGKDSEKTLTYEFYLGISDGVPFLQDSGSNHIEAPPTCVLPEAQWSHVAMTFDPDLGWARLLVNGHTVAEGSFQGTGTKWESFYLGGRFDEVTGTTERWAGGIRELRIWDHAMPDLEVRRRMYISVPFAEGLEGRWALNEGPGFGAAYRAMGFPYVLDAFGTPPEWRGIRGGDHTLFVQERDEAGNWSDSGSCTVTVDQTGPNAPVFDDIPTGTSDLTPTWSWASGDGKGGPTYWCSLDGGAWFSVGVPNWTPTEDLAEGPHTLEVLEQDPLGNWSEVASHTIYVDADIVTLEITTASILPDTAVGDSYEVTLSAQGGTQPYSWVDLTGAEYSAQVLAEPQWIGGGEPLELDGGTAFVELPWPFHFFGERDSYVWVYDNGTLSFSNGSASLYGCGLTMNGPDDGIFLTTAPDMVAFRWKGTCDYLSDLVEFETVLYSDGRIVCSYLTDAESGGPNNLWGSYIESSIEGPWNYQSVSGPASMQYTPRMTLDLLDLTLSEAGVLEGEPYIPGQFDLRLGVEDSALPPAQQTRSRLFTLFVEFSPPWVQEEDAYTAGTSNTIEWWGIADEYYIECATDPDFNNVVASNGWFFAAGGLESYEFVDLDDEATYYYRVKGRIYATGEESEWSATEQSAQDASLPVGTILINNGDPFTNNAHVALNLTGEDFSGVYVVKFSNDGVDWSDWILFSEDMERDLTGDDGPKTIQAIFMDFAYNVSEVVTSPSIYLDRLPPIGNLVINDHASYTTTPVVSVHCYVDYEGGSGMSQMRLQVNGVWEDWMAYADTTLSRTLTGPDGETYIYVEYTDNAGNVGESSDTIILDTTPPVITLLGDAEVSTLLGEPYDDAGATAEDNLDGNITGSIVTGGLPVNTSVVDDYTVTYDVTDAAGNPADQVTRTVHVVDTTKPVITLVGEAEVTVEVHGSYTDEGATAEDNLDGDITANIITGGLPINTSVVDDYTVTYNVTDAAGNPADQVTRTVHVVDTTKPVITLVGEDEVTVEVHGSYTDEGATAEDNYDGNITANIVTGGLPVNTSVVDDYTVTYDVTDATGNPADTAIRTVHVIEAGEGEGEEGEGEGEEGGFYFNSFADGATIYVSSSAGPIPLVFTVTAPAGTQSVTYEDNGTELTLEEPPYRFVSWMNVDSLEYGPHDISITALLADNSELSTQVTFTLAAPPLNSDLDANGIPDNPFELLNDGDLWLNQTYVHEMGATRVTAVRRIQAETVTDNVRTEVLTWEAPEAGVAVSVPGAVLDEGEAGVIIVSTAVDLYTLLGDNVELMAAAGPEGYVLPEAGMYTEVSVLTTFDDSNYEEVSDDDLSANPVDISINLPSAPGTSAALYAHPTDILSDSMGLFVSPAGEGWTNDDVSGLSVEGAQINARLTSLSLIAPFVLEPVEGEGEGEEGEGEGEGEGEEEEPPFACFNTDKLARQARIDLIPVAVAIACL
ncbi:MAG: DUF5011 domain-containing protein, partial [Candidatus Hydrogenedentes bacterium]|nr:DUF5011 domain-containing protein [Candidatus Hydrogenedentota bacterium]